MNTTNRGDRILRSLTRTLGGIRRRSLQALRRLPAATKVVAALAVAGVIAAPLSATAIDFTPGGSVTVTGAAVPGGTVSVDFVDAFSAGETVSIAVTGGGSVTLAALRSTSTLMKTASGTGAVSVQIVLPTDASGAYAVTGAGLTSGSVATAAITVSTAAPAFADVNAFSTFYSYVEWMFSSGISTGTAQPPAAPMYKPTASVSRGAMAVFLLRLSGETFTAPTVSTFADVDVSSPFFAAVEWTASKGISTGTVQETGKPLFKPVDPVTRQAMAVFLARYHAVDVSTPPMEMSFADVPPSGFGAAAIGWMQTSGISTGSAQPAGLPLFKPVAPVTREAMAAFLYRLAHLPVAG